MLGLGMAAGPMVSYSSMGQSLPMPPPGFDDLPVEDQIDYIQSLWDRIATAADQVPLQEWQRRVLAERLTAHRAACEDSPSWSEVLDRVELNLPRAK